MSLGLVLFGVKAPLLLQLQIGDSRLKNHQYTNPSENIPSTSSLPTARRRLQQPQQSLQRRENQIRFPHFLVFELPLRFLSSGGKTSSAEPEIFTAGRPCPRASPREISSKSAKRFGRYGLPKLTKFQQSFNKEEELHDLASLRGCCGRPPSQPRIVEIGRTGGLVQANQPLLKGEPN